MNREADRRLERLRAICGSSERPGRRLRQALIARVSMRYDSEAVDGLDEIGAAVRGRSATAETAVFAALLSEGMASGAFAAFDPQEAARTLMVATEALLPGGTASGPNAVEDAGRVADLMLAGLRRRSVEP